MRRENGPLDAFPRVFTLKQLQPDAFEKVAATLMRGYRTSAGRGTGLASPFPPFLVLAGSSKKEASAIEDASGAEGGARWISEEVGGRLHEQGVALTNEHPLALHLRRADML